MTCGPAKTSPCGRRSARQAASSHAIALDWPKMSSKVSMAPPATPTATPHCCFGGAHFEDGAPQVGLDLIDGLGGVDDAVVPGIGGGLGEVVAANLLEVFSGALLDAVALAAEARHRLFDGHVQQQHPVRPAVLDGDAPHRPDLVDGQAVAAGLVG